MKMHLECEGSWLRSLTLVEIEVVTTEKSEEEADLPRLMKPVPATTMTGIYLPGTFVVSALHYKRLLLEENPVPNKLGC